MASDTDTETRWRVWDATATGLASDTPVLERGSTISLKFVFEGGTLHDDGTLHADGTVHGDTRAHYRRLLERLEFTDACVRRGVSHNGVPWIRERLPARAPVDSQVVLVEPHRDVLDVEPFWAAVVGGSTDNRPVDDTGARWITLELFVLAAGVEYLGDYSEAYGFVYGSVRESGRNELLADLGTDVI